MFRLKNLSEDFQTKIIEKAAGNIPQNVLEDFLQKLESEIQNHYFTFTSESNLLRIIQNQFDFRFFINECIKYPHQIEILLTVANNSNYLSDILVRNPEYFFWIINPSVLNQRLSIKYYSELLENSLTAFKSFDSKINILRNFKRKEILRIGLKDLFLKEKLINTTKNLSDLAVAISSKLFQLCHQEILSKYKIDKTNCRYVLLSLGKLGGNELNYSSDIDLIAFYDKNDLVSKNIYFHQILTETILLFIETASKKTGSGFLYRVDFRLRPDGRNAQLCGSYDEYIRYYETRGEDWERQMLIKANYLSGSKNLYDKFYNYVSKFIYQSVFLVTPTEQIKKLKSSIEKQNNTEGNIKLTAGGIRDIEFAVQALQLINGAKSAELRNSNTIITIKKLFDEHYLSQEEKNELLESYQLYRRIEHYLQLMNDQQTHTIPEEGEIAEKIAHFLNFKDINSFKSYLAERKDSVQNIFSSIMNSEENILPAEMFNKINFADKNRALKNIEFLRTGKSITNKKQFDKRTTSAFEKIENQLFKFLNNSVDPDITLDNFSRIIKYANFPKIWYEEFKDQNFFELCLIVCEQSQKSVDFFAEDKNLRDDFLSRQCLIPIEKVNFYDLSYKSFLFRSSIQIVSRNLSADLFSDIYSDYLTKIFSKIFVDFFKDKEWANNFFIAAMGSFGTRQINFNSDIDLIFVVKNLDSYKDVQKDFQKLLQVLRTEFPGLEIDCRLRPEGKSSQLVWDIDAYKNYFTNRARSWEIQAFTKCRYLYGNNILYNNFIAHYIKTTKERDLNQIKKDLIDMRKKLLPLSSDNFHIKKSYGGLIDIDFILTYSLLTEQKLNYLIGNKSIYDKENFEVILQAKNLGNNLLFSFEFLKQLELTLQNMFNARNLKIPNNEIKLKKLANVLKFEDENSLNQKFIEVSNLIKKAFKDIFTN